MPFPVVIYLPKFMQKLQRIKREAVETLVILMIMTDNQTRAKLILIAEIASETQVCVIECFRGRHRGGRNFTSFLRFSGPFFQSTAK